VNETLRYWWRNTVTFLLCSWRDHQSVIPVDENGDEYDWLPNGVFVCRRCSLFTDKDGEPAWVAVEYE
jgi:hypothetical protein